MLSPYLNNFYKENGFGRITATYYTNLYIDKTNKENKYRTVSGPYRITTAGHKNRNRTAGPRNAHRHARSSRSQPLRRPNRQGAAPRRMPGSAGQIRRETVPEKVASDRFDRICKRGKRLPPKEAYPRRQRNPYRDDPSRRPCTERRPNRPDNLRLPVDSSGTHIAGTPAGSVSAEEVRQRAKRPSVPRKPTHDRPDVVPAFPAGRRCGFGKRFPGPFLACYRFLAYL